jgi:hypothetical protein
VNLEQFQSRLCKLGADIPQGTLKRWAYEGLIPRPHRYRKGKGGGRGRAASWTRAAIGDAAALWAIRNAGGRKLLQSKRRIGIIKYAVEDIFHGAQRLKFVAYTVPSPTTFPNAKWHYRTVESVVIQFDYRDFPGLDLIPGKAIDQLDTLKSLATVWICAKEKARRGMSIQQPARIIMHYRMVEADDTVSDEIGSCVLEKTTVEPAECDKITLSVNGVDLREWSGWFTRV